MDLCTDFGWRFPHKLNFGSLWKEIAKSVELPAALTFNTQRFSTESVKSSKLSKLCDFHTSNRIYLGQCNQ